MEEHKKYETVKTGITGLDDVLGGGLTANRIYLLQGSPGSGKTTFGLQFLLEGHKRGERVLYITLAETLDELEEVSSSHGWSLDGIEIYEMSPSEEELEPDNQLMMFQPSEVELSNITKDLLRHFEEYKPSRVVLDSLSEIRLLAQNALRYRRQILALKQYFADRDCTVLFIDNRKAEMHLESLVHGVINLEQLDPEYGAERRRLNVLKYRGRKYRGGYHDYVIRKGGLVVFPRLVAAEYRTEFESSQMSSGIKELDSLVGGGLDLGTSVLAIGPAGVGKSTLTLQYAANAAEQGKRAVIFIFDERIHSILERAKGLGMDLEKHVNSGMIELIPVDPAELSPGEFAQRVKDAAEDTDDKPGASVIVIDSLNGYMQAMPQEKFLISQLHELLAYLGHKQVITFLVVAQHGMLGASMATPFDTSYLADSVILFRFFESKGEVRQAISIVKKRSGLHERTIREFTMGKSGILIGQPLKEFHGVLTGAPYLEGNHHPTRIITDE